MARTLYRRDSSFMRFVSMIVALAFTMSLAGSGFAVSGGPAGDATDPALVASSEPTAAAEPVESADPVPEEEPVVPDAVDEGEPNKASPGEPTAKAVAASSGITAAGVTAQAGAGSVSIELFQGYGDGKWTNGNLGKSYREGDWVPYRLVLRNTGDAPVDAGDIAIGLDHFDPSPNPAVMFDQTRAWCYSVGNTAPTTNDANTAPAGAVSITPTAQDVPEGGSWGSAPTIRTDIASGTFDIGPGQYATVYFQGHLALTAYWSHVQPGTDGSGGYPGSSGHGYLRMDAGAKTLPLPSVEVPGGSVRVYKYYDTDMDGQKDANETQFLSGWTMHLVGSGGFTLDLQLETDANGQASFAPLPPGTYSVHEDMKPGWESKTPSPIDVTIVSDEEIAVYIGNFRPDVTKTWSLSIDGLPEDASPYVTYSVNGQSKSTDLSGSNPYTAQVAVPYGASITGIQWWVEYNGEDILLGTSDNETLTGNRTNSFDYDTELSGAKYSDTNGDGERAMSESGLPGWQIVLKRVVGSTETTYATAITGNDGAYSFIDVLPGTYKVYEVQQPGWLMTDSPAGSINVEEGASVSGLDFGNFCVAPSIRIVKDGPAAVHVGDVIEYTFDVTNTGNSMLTDVVVTDPLLWLTDYPIGTLAAGQTVSVTATISASAFPDPLPNTAVVTGSDLLGRMVTDSDSHVVDILKPAITVAKVANRDKVVSGAEVTYTYTVTNSGEETLTGVTLTDDKFAVDGGTIGTLVPGQSVMRSVTVPLSVTTTNVATAVGVDALGMQVSDTATEFVEVFNPAISIVKTVAPDTVLSGTGVVYTYTVENTGDIALFNVEITDDKLGVIGVIPSLPIGATDFLTANATILSDVTNVGTAVGYYGASGTDFFGSVTANDDAFVNVIAPSVSIDKSASASPILSGGTVTYTYVVTNDGDVPLVDLTVNDDKLGLIGEIPSLGVGESFPLTVSTVLDETTLNIATVTGFDERGNPVEDSDEALVEVFSPAISLEKTANPTTILSGETVAYTYVVENIGDLWLHDVVVTDDKLGAIGSIPSLDIGEVATLTTTAAIAADTLNVGTAVAEYGDAESEFGGTVEDSDDAIVDVVAPAIDVAKSASPDAIVAGEEVVYTYTVTNIGDVDLFDVSLTDDKLGPVGALESLAVGASSTFTMTTTLSEPTTNTVVALGTDEFGHQVSDEAQAFVDVALPFTPPDMTIEKSADKRAASAGDTVRYTLTYRNLGPGVAEDIKIVDDFDERYVTVTDAAGGVVSDGKITWSVAGPLHPEDGPQTITYTVKIDSDLPADVKVVRNTVVISEPTEENTDNNSDSWSVDIKSEPFLPFTGGTWTVLVLAAMATAALGVMLRRVGASVA